MNKEIKTVFRLSTLAKEVSPEGVIVSGNLRFMVKNKSGNERFIDINQGNVVISDALISSSSNNYIIYIESSGSYERYKYCLIEKQENGEYVNKRTFNYFGINGGESEYGFGCLSEDRKDDNYFIRIIDKTAKKECILTPSLKIVGLKEDLKYFDLIDLGFRIIQTKNVYAYRHSRKRQISYIYDTAGELVTKTPYKISCFFKGESDLCMVRRDDGNFMLFSIEDNKIILSDSLALPFLEEWNSSYMKKVRVESREQQLPIYVNEWGEIEKDKTAFFTLEGNIAVFDINKKELVKYIERPEENFELKYRLYLSGSYRAEISSKFQIAINETGKFNFLCGNTFVSEEWIDSYEVFDSQGKKIDKCVDYNNAALIKCNIEGDFDYLELRNSGYYNKTKEHECFWRWRYNEFGKAKPSEEGE